MSSSVCPIASVHARSGALGAEWNVEVLVESIDESRRALDLRTSLPLAIVVFNRNTCRELDPSSRKVSFG